MPTLSVCLIVKDEALHLPRALASVQGLFDELVVVDTGSTDRSVAIAREFGAHVAHFTWCHDFSAARNFMIEQATGDWILSLDADESIAARDHAAIRALIARDDLDAALVPQRHYLPARTITPGWQAGAGGYDEGTPYAGYLDVTCRRLFRRRPWLRFRNRVHEELLSIDPARPLRETRGSWVIHHYGKMGSPDVLRAKADAYLRIGLAKVEDAPDDPRAHYELAIQHAELGDDAAAVASFRRTLELTPDFLDTWLRLGLCCFSQGAYSDAAAALREADRCLPEHAAEIAVARARVHAAQGDDAAAERLYRRALALNPTFLPAALNLASACRRQGRRDEAIACLGRLLHHAPQQADARLLRAELHVEAGDDAAALQDLSTIADGTPAAGAPQSQHAARLRARILMRARQFAEAGAAIAHLPDDHAETAALRGAIALGVGDVDAAIAHLRRSLAIEPTHEAAINLSAALAARPDQDGALDAAAEALRLAPASADAIERFTRLAGGSLSSRRGAGSTLTIFFYQPHSVPFDGTTPRTRGLGGTESAIVYLAEALARRGHRCVVFNNGSDTATVGGVEYARWERMPGRAVADRPDVVVGVRYWQLIGQARFAPLQILWTGDAFDQPFLEGLADEARRREIDLFMLQSAWQEQTFHDRHGIPWSRIVRTALGAASSSGGEISPATPDDALRPHRLVYASTPFRGLDVLLDVFPRIRAAVPDAELEIFSSMQVYGLSKADDEAQFADVYERANQPGVTLVGSVPQPELARRLAGARILAYPNHYAETFCIAAAEAQAAGCAVVTTRLGALPETVGDGGICLPGDPRTPAYRQAFVDACVALLRDDERWRAMSERARAHARVRYAWPAIAEGWERVCQAALTAEPPELDRIATHLTAGRAALAQRMLSRASRPDTVPSEAWQALEALTRWRGGEGPAPCARSLQGMGLYFPSLRRVGVIDDALRAGA